MKRSTATRCILPMQIAKAGCIGLSVLLCALGAALLAAPHLPARALGLWCGAVFTALGCVRLVGYFSRDLFRLAFQYDLEFGILSLAFGLLALLHPGGITGVLGAALGLLVLADALFKMRITRDARRFGIGAWWVVLGIALATAVLGAALLFIPGTGLRPALGITCIAEGLLTLTTTLAMVKIIRHQRQDETVREESL